MQGAQGRYSGALAPAGAAWDVLVRGRLAGPCRDRGTPSLLQKSRTIASPAHPHLA